MSFGLDGAQLNKNARQKNMVIKLCLCNLYAVAVILFVMIEALIISIVAFLLGSIPFALVIAKLAGTPNPLMVGSKNPGATNMTRIAGKKLGAVTFLLDSSKAAVAIGIIMLFQLDHVFAVYAFAFAVLGHIFSVFLRFKGGKGVASFVGGLLALNFSLGVFAVLVWLFMFVIRRISSLSALTMVVITSAVSVLHSPIQEEYIAIVVVSIVIILRHHQNIKDLVNGTED